MKIAQLVIGPAGAGKSTYVRSLMNHMRTLSRQCSWMNLDPAAVIDPSLAPSIDIQALVSLTDIMDQLHLGPNGGLVYALEFLLENQAWFADCLGDFQDDYIVIDCPGQIELYTHSTTLPRIVDFLQGQGYRVVAVYLMDSQFMADRAKFMSGVLSATSAMVGLAVPHINVISKMDLVQEADDDQDDSNHDFESFLNVDTDIVASNVGGRFSALDSALAGLIQEYDMVSFIPLNVQKEASLEYLLSHIDNAVQYGEDLEPKEPKELYNDEPEVEEAFNLE